MSVHTGAKPFVCEEPDCGRRFSVSSNLRRHEKVSSCSSSHARSSRQPCSFISVPLLSADPSRRISSTVHPLPCMLRRQRLTQSTGLKTHTARPARLSHAGPPRLTSTHTPTRQASQHPHIHIQPH
ncbi:hypothetical protein BCR39DRAFT_575573 [Naematelia encephala]|uniref:C2H2-type domain-containing protein n=1 Tax=Naematelia encephala TaxID=71784 RepID=A0A1Y2B417_9TREE|nr:hypothetical protein BCR39DRAFT_575573 [Naematelia encephala]